MYNTLVVSEVATLIIVKIDNVGRNITIESKMHYYKYEIQSH